jgi:hypothetical protein
MPDDKKKERTVCKRRADTGRNFDTCSQAEELHSPVKTRVEVLAGPDKKAVQTPTKGKRIAREYPESSAGFLRDADLQNRTPADLWMMVNEIYARHSHIFVNAEKKKHFSRQQWYTPKNHVDWSMLTTIEKANIKIIRKYQTSQNQRTTAALGDTPTFQLL